MSYTLATAAAATGLNKTTILRAIKSGKISAAKDPHGQWLVEPVELHRIYPPDAGRNTRSDAPQQDALAAVELQVKVLLAEHRVGDLKTALEDMRCQRDAWQAQAERLTITDQRPQPKPSWWQRLVRGTPVPSPLRQVRFAS
jgi:hypothetical protein